MSRLTFLPAGMLAFLLLPSLSAAGVLPAEVWIVVNKNVPDSRTVAEYYCQRRGVPRDNILTFDLPVVEDINRAYYEQKLAGPLRNALKDKRGKVKVLLTTYGVPLRIGADSPTADEVAQLAQLTPQLNALYKQRSDLDAQIAALTPQAQANPKGPAAAQLAKARNDRQNLAAPIAALEAQQRWLSHREAVAALDSDLALLWAGTYELRLWRDNPLYFRAPDYIKRDASTVVMTARLDGPSLAIVKGLVDQAIAAEAANVQGKVYIDAQGKKYDPKLDPAGMGYEAYDESLREMAALYTKAGYSVVLDNKPTLFAPGACPGCALYCGWYSNAKYIDSFTFVPGAVGYHIASSEAVSLRSTKVTFWCPSMLSKGITATLGPVAEPYTYGFPKPEEFFGFLGTGSTLVESYWSSLRYGSWMMVLVGDPLYRPFGRAPKIAPASVKPSPAGSDVSE